MFCIWPKAQYCKAAIPCKSESFIFTSLSCIIFVPQSEVISSRSPCLYHFCYCNVVMNDDDARNSSLKPLSGYCAKLTACCGCTRKHQDPLMVNLTGLKGIFVINLYGTFAKTITPRVTSKRWPWTRRPLFTSMDEKSRSWKWKRKERWKGKVRQCSRKDAVKQQSWEIKESKAWKTLEMVLVQGCRGFKQTSVTVPGAANGK